MRLYLVYRCPFGHRASIALREKQLAFEPVFFELGKRPPELEAAGPYAKSPTLFDGESRVWDGQVVLEYLEDRYPERPLAPLDAAGRAEMRMLATRVGNELGSKLGIVALETLVKPQKDEAKVAHAIREFLDALGAWDRQLEGRPFLVGDSLTLADITLFTIFPGMRSLTGLELPADRRHLRAWFDRMAARPSTPYLEPARA
jgi:glutathione S-transferase